MDSGHAVKRQRLGFCMQGLQARRMLDALSNCTCEVLCHSKPDLGHARNALELEGPNCPYFHRDPLDWVGLPLVLAGGPHGPQRRICRVAHKPLRFKHQQDRVTLVVDADNRQPSALSVKQAWQEPDRHVSCRVDVSASWQTCTCCGPARTHDADTLTHADWEAQYQSICLLALHAANACHDVASST